MEIEREERNGSGYQEKQEFITGLYYEYERLMFATARRYIDDRTEQEDVVQESLKKLIEKQERLAGLAQAAQAGKPCWTRPPRPSPIQTTTLPGRT